MIFQGSSIGIEIVEQKNSLAVALKKVLQYDNRILVEKFISGREITVGMVNGEVLQPVEIIPHQSTYDFHAKYICNKTTYKCPPSNLTSEQLKMLSNLAERTFKVFKCKGMGRVDFIMSNDGHFYILELNSIPGFTASSLLPMAAKAAGMTFSELCHNIISGAE